MIRYSRRATVLLLLGLIAVLATVHADVTSGVYHRGLQGNPVDLGSWHPDFASRCITPTTPRKEGPLVAQIYQALDYLSQEPLLFSHLMNRARQAGVLICIDNRADGARGYYDYHYNIVSVREKLPLMQKVAIILHELRHVDHVLNGYRLTLDYAMDEMVRLTYAVEGEVQAFSALYAWRMRKRGQEELWHALKGFEHYADIAVAFEEARKTGSEPEALLAAFRQWYRSDWRLQNYYRGCCMGYLDMLDESKQVESFAPLPDNFFSRLCQLPGIADYGCAGISELQQEPQPAGLE